MNRPSKLASLLFIVLSFMVSLLLGIGFAVIFGAAKGQGLAAGAILLGYGVIFGFIGMVLCILLLKNFTGRQIRLFNRILLVFLAVCFMVLFYRISGMSSPKKFAQIAQAVSLPSPKIAQLRSAGLGMVALNADSEIVYFYGAYPEIGQNIIDSIIFTKNHNGPSIAQAPPWFQPAHLKPDYGIFFLRMAGVNKLFAEVVVNETSQQTAWMERANHQIIYWPDFLLQVHSIAPLFDLNNALKNKPLETAGTLDVAYAWLSPLHLSGDWIYAEAKNDNDQPLGAKGWIRWQKDGQLLISYSLLL